MTKLDQINFTWGVPADESYPIAELVDAAATALRERGTGMLSYGPALGFAPLRDWLARWQGVQTEQVLIANGSLQIVEFLCIGGPFVFLAPDSLVAPTPVIKGTAYLPAGSSTLRTLALQERPMPPALLATVP